MHKSALFKQLKRYVLVILGPGADKFWHADGGAEAPPERIHLGRVCVLLVGWFAVYVRTHTPWTDPFQ